MTMMRMMILAIAALAVTACTGYSLPRPGQQFIYAGTAQSAQANDASVFVDGNGTLYPSAWETYRRDVERRHSLLRAADDAPALRTLIDRDEARQLAELAAFGRGKQRIFILVHGYNNSVDEADDAFARVEAKLDRRAGDGVVRFYWDGLTAKGLGAGRIWFRATGNSKLAGVRGLRRLLDQFAGTPIYIISHSRGASVVLSALGNPTYDGPFKAAVDGLAARWYPGAAFTTPAPLAARGNAIHILAVAPAIGRIDFCDTREQARLIANLGCRYLRELDPQVKSYRYTVNARDPVLNKVFGLRYEFNPTTLGIDPEVGRALKDEKYPMLRAYLVDPPMRAHGFKSYTATPAFDRMLADAGIAKADE